MTPNEYTYSYQQFMSDDDVYYISEHRLSYDNNLEFDDIMLESSDIIFFPISVTRFAAEEARKILKEKGIKVSIIHQLGIKPFIFKEKWRSCLNNSKFGGIVMDDDYEQGVASSIAHKMMIQSTKNVYTLGLDHKTAGFHESVDNLPPNSEKIVRKVLDILSV